MKKEAPTQTCWCQASGLAGRELRKSGLRRRQTEKGPLKSCQVCLKDIVSMWKGEQEYDCSEAEEEASAMLDKEKEKEKESPPPPPEGQCVQTAAEVNPPGVLENEGVEAKDYQ